MYIYIYMYITTDLYAISAMSMSPCLLIWVFVRFCDYGIGTSVFHGVVAMAGVSILWHLYPQLSDHAWMPSCF